MVQRGREGLMGCCCCGGPVNLTQKAHLKISYFIKPLQNAFKVMFDCMGWQMSLQVNFFLCRTSMKTEAINFWWRLFKSHVWGMDDWKLFVSNCIELPHYIAGFNWFRELHLTVLIKAFILGTNQLEWSKFFLLLVIEAIKELKHAKKVRSFAGHIWNNIVIHFQHWTAFAFNRYELPFIHL